MSWTSIPHAHAYWRDNRDQTDPPTNLDDAETFILSERPRTTAEAACILDVVCASGGDARCDGLDLAALGRVHMLLSPAG